MKHSDFRVEPSTRVKLSEISTTAPKHLDESAARARTVELVEEFTELQNMLFAGQHHRVLVVLQATDTGGKDGAIRNVFGPLNPQGLRVASFKVPTGPELAHDYLWRVHQQVPANGELVVFNRSHYEDVLVVRVHNYVETQQWKKRYGQIVNFEQMLADEGTTIIKLYLHITKDEQAERLRARLEDPAKRWKFSLGDLEERGLWSDYRDAFEDMLSLTSTPDAPWYVVPAGNKWYRDLVVAEIMVDTLTDLDLSYPPGDEGLDAVVIT